LNVTNSPALRELIVETLESVGKAQATTGWSIAIGAVGALFGASGIFMELDAAFEKIFLVKAKKRSIWGDIKRFLLDRGIALLLVLGTSATLLFGMVVLSAMELLASQIRFPSNALPGVLTYAGTLALTAIGLSLCYRVVPEPPVRFRSALAAGALAATLLALVRLPLSWALTHLTSYAAYGIIGAMLVLVTWFYVAGCILLFGAALTAVLDERRYGRRSSSP
jgi:membrane protein